MLPGWIWDLLGRWQKSKERRESSDRGVIQIPAKKYLDSSQE
jgi:hypothetical protein